MKRPARRWNGVAVFMGLIGVSVSASAGTGWSSWREPLPARWVQRSIGLPVGWTTFRVEWERRTVLTGFDQSAYRQPLAVPYLTDGVSMEARHGVSRWLELGMRVPMVVGRYRGEAPAVALGDIDMWVRLQPWQFDAPASSLGVDLGWTFPGAAPKSEVPLVVGAHAAVVRLAYRQQIGPVWIEGQSGVKWRLPDYRGDPPDSVHAGLEAGVQLGPIGLGLGSDGGWFSESRVRGQNSDPTGAWVSVSGFAIVQFTRGSWLDFTVDAPVWALGHGRAGASLYHPQGVGTKLGLGVAF